MKLWLVLYVGQQIGGTWGPLPYDMKECQARAADRQATIQKWIDTRVGDNGAVVTDDQAEFLKKWRMECQEHPTRPKNELP